MVKNFIKITFRNLLKYKGYSIINILGLAIGVACTILILLFVQDEFSYDTYHEHADDIYRAGLDAKIMGNEFKGAVVCTPFASTIMDEFPEVISATRIKNFGFPVIRYEDKVFSEERWYSVDSTFFDVFTVKWLRGNPKGALTQALQVVLTESMAKKYFGNENPIGKILNSDRRRDYTVVGVVEDVPANSHFHYDFLGSLRSYEDGSNQRWISNNYQTYFRLQPGTDWKAFEKKMNKTLLSKYVGPQIQQFTGVPWEQTFDGSEGYYNYFIQPLKDIHLYSNVDYELEPNSDATYVYIFLIVAISILVIACVNFMNLATARSANRAKEVGIRKTLGSLKGQLIWQFLAESTFMALLSVLIALLLVQLALPQFNAIASKNLFIDFTDPYTIPGLILLIVLVGAAAGLYPAFYLSSFNPALVLKEGAQKGGRRKWLRSALVIFQFSVSVILITGTYVVEDQLDYLQNKKLGFKKDHILIVEKTDDIGARIVPFKEELLQYPEIVSVSNSNNLFGYDFGNTVFRKEGDGRDVTHIIWNMSTDVDFAKTYELKLKSGRYFSREFSTDTNAVVLNESAVKTLGIEGDPVGQNIMSPRGLEGDATLNIIGVVKDFHFQSLHNEIKPFILFPFQRGQLGRYLAVKFKSDNVKATVARIEKSWLTYANDQAFEYAFFDEEYNKVYTSEFRTGEVFELFSIIAILIACLGLFGLAAFMAEQRTKEIGIRKTMGASIPGLMILLCKEFTKWVLIANLIAIPIAWYWMNSWLDNFAYRIDLTIVAFIISAIVSLLIALITVSYQAVKASLANPIDSLKYE